jgi:hypothetical protein
MEPCRGPWLRFYPALLRHGYVSYSAALFCQRKCASLMCCGATPICFLFSFVTGGSSVCIADARAVQIVKFEWPASVLT